MILFVMEKIEAKDGKIETEQSDDLLRLEQEVLSKYSGYKGFVAHREEKGKVKKLVNNKKNCTHN